MERVRRRDEESARKLLIFQGTSLKTALDTYEKQVHSSGMCEFELMYKRLRRTLPKGMAFKLLCQEAEVQRRSGKLDVDSSSFLVSLGWCPSR